MIEQAIQNKREKNIKLLGNAYTLPALPFIIEEVNRVIEDPRASASNLGEVISKDQGLVTKILAVANSPLYGIPRRVSTIDFAIIILGFNHIKNIVVAFSLMDSIGGADSAMFDRKKFWLHSIMMATAAKRIADDLGYHVSGEAFTAGLLHDLGIPIVNKFFPKEYKQIVESVKEKGLTFKEAEVEALGLDHQEIGKLLVERWNLPAVLAEVVGCHHEPSLSNEHKILTSLVHVTDYMTSKLNIGEFLWDENYAFDPSVLTTLRLGNEEYFAAFINSYQHQFMEQLEILQAI